MMPNLAHGAKGYPVIREVYDLKGSKLNREVTEEIKEKHGTLKDKEFFN